MHAGQESRTVFEDKATLATARHSSVQSGRFRRKVQQRDFSERQKRNGGIEGYSICFVLVRVRLYTCGEYPMVTFS